MIIRSIWNTLFNTLFFKIEDDFFSIFICVTLTILAIPIEVILLPIELISWIVYKKMFKEEESEDK